MSANGGKMVESDEQPKRDSGSGGGGGGAAMAALHQCELIQNMIEISISSLQGLRTKCAASNDLTQQEIRTLEVGEDPYPPIKHTRTYNTLFAVKRALSLVPLAESRRVKMRSHEAPHVRRKRRRCALLADVERRALSPASFASVLGA